MVLRVVWDKANVDVKVGETKDGLPIYEGKILFKNDEIPDAPEVSEFQRFILLSIGAVKDDGLASKLVKMAEEQALAPTPDVVLTPDQPPAPTAPAGGLGDFTGAGEPTSGNIQGQTPVVAPPAELPDRPSDRASVQTWEDYAVKLGLDRATAESYNKADLIAAADRRRAELENA